MRRLREHSILPGFGVSLGLTLSYLGLLFLLPLSALFVRASGLGLEGFWNVVTRPRALAALGLSIGAALSAATLNAVFGTIAAWVLVRYRFLGRRLLDALVDLPFALPTAVSGIALTSLLGPKGWIGAFLERFGLRLAFTRVGIVIALVFIGLPFVVRTLQPAIEDLSSELEEAAASLGAGRITTLRRVVLPILAPAWLTGFALAFARGVGEYGSVVFIAGNMPMKTEILPLLIVVELEQYEYEAAAALGVALLLIAFALLLSIHSLQLWEKRRATARA